MLTAINRVHAKNGPWVGNGGYEYKLVLIAAVLALAETGPGSPSVDAALGERARRVRKWAALALLAGVGSRDRARASPRPTDAPEPAAEPETESQGGGRPRPRTIHARQA